MEKNETVEISKVISYNKQQIEHVRLFQQLVQEFCNELMREAINHDQSKFGEIEYETFVQSQGALNQSKTGKDQEYQKFLNSKGIQSHIQSNPHHPEYWDHRGLKMPIQQGILMYFDWLSRSIQRGTGMEAFWQFNTEKLKTQKHILPVAEAMRSTWVSELEGYKKV